MFYSFTGRTANEVWTKATAELLKMEVVSIESRAGNTIELLHSLIHVENPIQRWVTQRMPPISIGYALAELIWILAGSNDAHVINYWNPALPKFSGNNSEYHGAYGYRIRHAFGFDQLDHAYQTLKNNPDSRQSVILIWDPRTDYPDEMGKPVNDDIPCNICSLLKVRNNRLEWTQIMRSNDIYLGLPYNFIQFTSLQEIIAGWLRIDVGSYCHYSDSLHLYHKDIPNIKISEEVNIENEDSLMVTKDECYAIVNQVYKNMIEIALKNISENELFILCELDTKVPAYRNIMYIIALYAADRKGYKDLSQELKEKCTNDLYLYLWDAWKSSKNKGGNNHD